MSREREEESERDVNYRSERVEKREEESGGENSGTLTVGE